jgi:cytoskeletal protein CcmA (bactofilin family)
MADTPKGAVGTGLPQQPPVNQIVGTNNLGPAVTGTSYGGVGVSGTSVPPVGADSLDPNVTTDGIFGEGKNGVHGVSSFGELGNWAQSNGVLGTSQVGIGIHGVNGAGSGTTPKYGCGTWGESDNGYGVYGASKTASGVYGTSGAGFLAGEFAGDVSVTGKLTLGEAGTFSGDITVRGTANLNTIAATGNLNLAASAVTLTGDMTTSGKVTAQDMVLSGADCAEEFEVAGASRLEAGTVVIFDDAGAVSQSAQPYNKRVAGVVSGAGAYRPGIILDQRSSSTARVPVALMGKVYCKVDAAAAPIVVGDLLTTSATTGHAMKAEDPLRSLGSVIGKALGGLDRGRGLIPILVMLR